MKTLLCYIASGLLGSMLLTTCVYADSVQFCSGDGCFAYSGDDYNGYDEGNYYGGEDYYSSHRHHRDVRHDNNRWRYNNHHR